MCNSPRKLINKLFLLSITLMLPACFIKALVSPVDEIEYETRPANKASAFSVGSYLDSDFQDSMESALADQVPLAIKSKKLYNTLNASAALPVISALQRTYTGYIRYKGIDFYRDMLVYSPTTLSSVSGRLSSAADKINLCYAGGSSAGFYVYYVETDRDIQLDTGEKEGLYEYFSSLLKLPAENVSRLELEDYEQYRQLFMKSDHHWSGRSSYAALTDICAMLGVDPVTAAGEHTVCGRYLGTKAAGIEGFPAEDFTIMLYDFTPMQISSCGVPLDDYGMQSQFIAGGLESFSYGDVFGGDYGELVFDTGRAGENLLVLGDSYDNAIIKALAGRFSTTYSVDLRAFATDTGSEFDMASYIKEHDIDKVLLIGGSEYFIGLDC